MRRRSLLGVVVLLALLNPWLLSAQDPRLTIRSVRLDAPGDTLTITGTGFGAAPAVAIEDEPVTVMPGGSDTQLVVPIPAVLTTTPGTYRLTVVDPVRHVGDTFVVVGPQTATLSSDGAAEGSPDPDRRVQTTGSLGAKTLVSSATGGGTAPTTAAVIDTGLNTALGVGALGANTTGLYNAALGVQALLANTTGDHNTGTGAFSLYSNTTGDYNTANGEDALFSNTTGSENAAVGKAALKQNSTGVGNSALGAYALEASTTGHTNTASGASALKSNTTGNDNTAAGAAALLESTTASGNTAIGRSTLVLNQTGNFNTAVGTFALYANRTSSNTAVGVSALASTRTGDLNVGMGREALYSNETGGFNSAFGYRAFYTSTGSGNVGVGTGTFSQLAAGDLNTGTGFGAGSNVTSGSYNLMIGANVYGEANDSNTIRIGLPFTSGMGQNRTFVAGIRGTTVTGGAPVVIDAASQLGTPPAGPYFTDSGRVGIGTAAPETKLQLLTSTNDGLMIKDGVTQGIFYASGLLGHSFAIGTQSNHPIVFGTNNTFDRLTLAANGNIGVGTTTPAAKFDVTTSINDGLRLSDGTLTGILFASGYLGKSFAFGTQTNHAFIFGTNDTWGRLTIAANGNIGIGTLTPTQPLQMASGAYVSAGGVWTNASSRSLKQDITRLAAGQALDAFARLDPVTFAYTAEPGQTHVGFIAEDVPALVAAADRKSLSAMDLVALLTKVVQVKSDELATQRQRIDDLLLRLEQLERQAVGR